MTGASSLYEFFDAEVEAAPRFRIRREGIPGDFRIAWRVSVLALLVERTRAQTASIDQLQTLWWAVRSSATRDLFLRWYSGSKAPDELLVRFDPSVNLTIDLSCGAGVVSRQASGAVKLTEVGTALVEQIYSDDESLVAEKAFLRAIPGKISQKRIRELLEWK